MSIHKRSNIVAIEALRGIAVISVVLYHYSWFIHPLESTFLRKGYIGVDIFFIISGFLACYTTAGSTPSLSHSAKYLCSRVIRIWPAYCIVTILYVFTKYIVNSTYPGSWALIKSLAFLPQSSMGSPSYGAPILDVGWTLNYEFFFTLSLALAF